MTREEFNQLITYYLTAFPQTRTWMGDVTKVPDPAKLKNIWYKTLSRITLIAATTAIDRILDGRLEPVDARWRDQTALILRGYGGRIMDDEKKARRRVVAKEGEISSRPRETYPAGWLLLAAQKLWKEGRSEGRSDEAIRVQVSREIDRKLEEAVVEA